MILFYFFLFSNNMLFCMSQSHTCYRRPEFLEIFTYRLQLRTLNSNIIRSTYYKIVKILRLYSKQLSYFSIHSCFLQIEHSYCFIKYLEHSVPELRWLTIFIISHIGHMFPELYMCMIGYQISAMGNIMSNCL